MLVLQKSTKKKEKWYKDRALSNLAALKKKTWDCWKAERRPINGRLYEFTSNALTINAAKSEVVVIAPKKYLQPRFAP